MNSTAAPGVMAVMDRLSIQAIERHQPTGWQPDGAAAVLVGQFIGRNAAEDVATAVRLCTSAGALAVERADADVLLGARRSSGSALSAGVLRASSDDPWALRNCSRRASRPEGRG